MDITVKTVEGWLNSLVGAWLQECGGNWKKWTAAKKNEMVKAKFHEEGEKLGYFPYSKMNKAFLYDFCWAVHGKDDRDDGTRGDGTRRLLEVILAMELEFSETQLRHGIHAGVRYDFNKLLQSDARYKVFCFQMPKLARVNEAIQTLKEDALAYRSKVVAEFFICGWAYRDGGSKWHCVSVPVSPK